MALNFLAIASLGFLLPSLLFHSSADALPQNGQVGYVQGAHVPILYEAYYPEPREWNAQTSLREIERLRELTSQLLREEEQLGQLAAAAAAATAENALEPRNQVLRYVFSGNAQEAGPAAVVAAPPPPRADDPQVQVASLTISDVGPHKTRHHHGQANWLLRRLAA